MPVPRFLVFDGLGAFLWVSAFAALGYGFSDQLEWMAAYFLRWGSWLLMILLGSLAGYILWKYCQRQRFLYRLRIARISPKELLEKLDAGEQLMILDLRQPLDIEIVPYAIPGALRIATEELGERHQEIPRDREIVLYCS
jgi:hypothetical protein